MITLYEPLRGKQLLTLLNSRASSNEILFHGISILADVFVFVYPILLLFLFFRGYSSKNKSMQFYSISILLSTAIAVWINILIQFFIWKERPETLQWLKLILKHVPSISFPSDHAAVSMAFAIGFIMSMKLLLPKSYRNRSYFLITASLIMGICRVAVAVHRPTDILIWWIIGIIWGYTGYTLSNTKTVQKLIYWLISISNTIIGHILPQKHV